MSQVRSTTMTAESIEQLKARLEKEKAFQKRLEQIWAEQRQRSHKEY
jgi:hypothetical protein